VKISTASFFLVLLIPVGALFSTDPNNNVNPILIGHVSPLTGGDAYIGEDQLRGAQLAVSSINKSGGVLGRPLKLVIEDDQGSSGVAASVASRLCANSEIVAVVGHLNSHCSNSAAPKYNACSLAMLTPVTTSDKLTSEGRNNVFRVCIRNSDQAPVLAQFAVGRKLVRFGLIHDNRDYGRDLTLQFRAALKRYPSAQIVGEETISVAESNFRTALARIRRGRPDAIVLGAMAREAALLMTQARELGIKTVFIGGDGLFSKELVERAGSAANGTIISHIAPIKSLTKESKFFDEYQTSYHEHVRAYAPLSYDCIGSIAAALKHAGKVDRSAVIAALHSPTFSHIGVTGKISFDNKGERTARITYLYEIKNGSFEQVHQQ